MPQPPRDSARLVETLARTIDHAHNRQLIHRDLKPDNILLTPDGVPKIVDFGLARQLDTDQTAMTVNFVGTPAYAAPEQVDERFGKVSPVTDVYALGVVLYELLTGRVPFTGSSIGSILQRVVENEPVPPRQLKRDCPRDLETICLKCLQKHQIRRYGSAVELADDLRRYLAGEPILARPVGPVERVLRLAKRNPAVAGLLAMVFGLLSLATLGSFLATVRIDQARRQAEASAKQALMDRDAAVQAQRTGKEKLLQAMIAEAQASSRKRLVGQRYQTLATIRQAVALAKELDEPAETYAKLRNIAASALALADVRELESVKLSSRQASYLDPTGQYHLIIEPNGTVRVVRLRDRVEVARLDSSSERYVAVAFSPDGQFAYLACDQFGLRRWRMNSSQPEVLVAPPEPTKSETFCHLWVTPDGRHLLCGRSLGPLGLMQASIHQLPSGRETFRHVVRLPNDLSYYWKDSVALSPDGKRFAYVEGGYMSELRRTVKVVDTQTGNEIGQYQPSGTDQCLSIVWTNDSRTLAVGHWNNTLIDLWDTESNKLGKRIRDLRGGAPLLAAGYNGQLLVGWSSWMSTTVCWHPQTGTVLLQSMRISGTFSQRLIGGGLAYFEHGAAQQNTKIVILEPSSVYRVLSTKEAENVSGARLCSMHPDGRLFAQGNEKGVWLFDLDTGVEVAKLPLRGGFSVAFCPNTGDLLTNGPEGTFRWPVRIDNHVVTLGPPQILLTGVGNDNLFALSDDGQLLAACRYRHVMLLDPSGRKHRLPVPLGPFDSARHTTFLDSDNRWLSVYDHSLRKEFTIETATGKIITDPEQLKIAHQQRRIVPSTEFGVIRLLDSASSKTLVEIQLPEVELANFMKLSPDGTLLYYNSFNSSALHVWDLRVLRQQLAELGLDWDAPPLPPAPPDPPGGRAMVPALTARFIGSEAVHSPIVRRECVLLKATVELTGNPFDPEAHYALAEHIYRSDPANALRHLALTLTLQPDHQGALCLRSQILLRANQKNQALVEADQAKAVGSQALLPRSCRADVLLALGRYDEALPELTGVLTFFPNDYFCLCKRAKCYEMLKQPELAQADWQRAANLLNTAHPIILNNQAWTLVTGPEDQRDPVWALRLIESALKRQPQQATFHNTHGVVLYRLGRYAAAVEALNESLRLHKGEYLGFDLYFLAMCRAKLEQHQQARADYDRANDWLAKQKNLSPAERQELIEFQAEAREVLRAAGLEVD